MSRKPSETTLLIVDDEAPLRAALVFEFKRRGYRTLEAESGKQALEALVNNPVDLILTDVRMPDGDGVFLLDSVRGSNPELPVVIFVTGFSDISVEEAFDRGADAVFSKPFDRKALAAKVESALRSREEQWVSGAPGAQAVGAALLSLKFEGLEQAIRARLLAFGRGGMFVALEDPHPVDGAGVRFKLAFADGRESPYQGEGIVRWVRPAPREGLAAGCGIEFMRLEDAMRAEILRHLAESMPRAFIPKG